MKKSVIVGLLTIFFGNVAFSQSDEFVLTWPTVESEAKKSDADIANPKKAANIKTWMERGRRYLEVYNFDAKNIFYSLSTDQLPFIMKGGAKSERAAGDTTIYSYDRVDLYFVSGKLVKYARIGRAKEVFFQNHSSALDVATEAYLKAKTLDKDGKKSKMIGDKLKELSDLYTKEAYFPYYAGNYALAADYFTKSGNIVRTGYTSDSDSAKLATLNNCGEINKAAQKYDQAISFYNDVISMSKQPTSAMYSNIYYCQLMQKDTTAAINTMLQIVEKFPNDSLQTAYFNQLIELYIKTNQTENALAYLQKASNNDPSNSLYLFNMGYLYETMKDEAKAIEYYEKAIAANPKDENANLNLGVLYEDKGNDLLKAADKLYGKKGYKEKREQGMSYLKKAYPYIETFADVTTNEASKRNAYRDLMSIYMQLAMMDKYKATKNKYDDLNL